MGELGCTSALAFWSAFIVSFDWGFLSRAASSSELSWETAHGNNRFLRGLVVDVSDCTGGVV